MEQPLLATLLLILVGTAAALLLRQLILRPSSVTDEPQEFSDIYQSTLLALLHSTTPPLRMPSYSQSFPSQEPLPQAPKDYAVWDHYVLDTSEKTVALPVRG